MTFARQYPMACPNDGRIDDWGYVVAVTAYGYGAMLAMQRAMRAADAAGYQSVRAIRATLRGDNPDPESYPSEFEVLVRVKDCRAGGIL